MRVYSKVVSRIASPAPHFTSTPSNSIVVRTADGRRCRGNSDRQHGLSSLTDVRQFAFRYYKTARMAALCPTTRRPRSTGVRMDLVGSRTGGLGRADGVVVLRDNALANRPLSRSQPELPISSYACGEMERSNQSVFRTRTGLLMTTQQSIHIDEGDSRNRVDVSPPRRRAAQDVASAVRKPSSTSTKHPRR